MPPKKRKQYDTKKMGEALVAVRENGMSVKAAAEEFNVPRSTLRDKLKGSPLDIKPGPRPFFTSSEENTLVYWITKCFKAGFPITKSELLNSVGKLVQELVKRDPDREFPFTDGKPARHWYESFMKRHPGISFRTPQNLTKSRAAVTQQNIINWHGEVLKYLKEKRFMVYPDNDKEFFDPETTPIDPQRPNPTTINAIDILKEPKRILNADEAALFLNPKGEKVLVPRGEKSIYHIVNTDEKECLTVMMCGNAAGDIVDPLIVFKYVRVPGDIAQLIPKHWGIGRSDSGWMTAEVFFEYITNIVYPWLLRNKIAFPVILFIDGHTSHQSLPTSRFCDSHGIILVALYPNSTHIIQPMDVAVFRTLKGAWKVQTNEWRHANMHQELKKKDFAPLLAAAIEKAVKPEVLQNGFRKCGLFPYDVSAIDLAKIKSVIDTSTNEKPQHDDGVKNPPIGFLKNLEMEIGTEKLTSFENCINLTEEEYRTNLKEEDLSLFLLWKKLVENFSGINTKDDTISKTTNVAFLPTTSKDAFTTSSTMEDLFLPSTSAGISTSASSASSKKKTGTCVRSLAFSPTDFGESITENDAVIRLIDSEPGISSVEKMQLKETLSSLNDIIDGEGVINMNAEDSHALCIISQVNNTNDSPTQTKLLTPVKDKNRETDPLVPSPFKAAMFWPEPKTIFKKGRSKEKVPSVISSESYRIYIQKKEEEKAKKERLKEERKQARLVKASKREEQKKLKPPPKKRAKKRESDDEESDVDGDLFDVTDTEKGDASDVDDNKPTFEEASYVIVDFEGEYFPGIVIKKEKDGAEVKVMCMAGPEDWRWPDKDDIVFYPNSDIKRVIQAPALKNSRGIYSVPEIKSYRNL
jgi:hypothetical protein